MQIIQETWNKSQSQPGTNSNHGGSSISIATPIFYSSWGFKSIKSYPTAHPPNALLHMPPKDTYPPWPIHQILTPNPHFHDRTYWEHCGSSAPHRHSLLLKPPLHVLHALPQKVRKPRLDLKDVEVEGHSIPGLLLLLSIPSCRFEAMRVGMDVMRDKVWEVSKGSPCDNGGMISAQLQRKKKKRNCVLWSVVCFCEKGKSWGAI